MTEIYAATVNVCETPAGYRPIFVADIGGSFIKFGRSDRQDHIEELEQVANPAYDFDNFCATLVSLMQKYADGERSHIPLGLSIAAMRDPQNAQVFSANIPCLTGRPLERELGDFLNRPVIMANDADCFGLAEAVEGVAKNDNIVFSIILGTGVGGALVIDKNLVCGAGGVTGEWGHGAIANNVVELAGEGEITIPHFVCGCGNKGCLDTIGSARGLERLDLYLNGLTRDSYTILQAWNRQESQAVRTVNSWLQLVANALATVVNIIGADIVPVGGGLAAATKLISKLDEAVRQRTLYKRIQPLIVPGYFPKVGGLRGAAILARQKLL